MKKLITLSACIFAALLSDAQGPAVTSWVRNTTGATGYGGILSNVQTVQYDASNVYISCTCIPGYSIGPWTGNPNTPSNQNFVFKITRNPQQNTGTPVAVGLGHIGVWTNGVSIFNASDAQSYNNAGVWNRNAYYYEGPGFDNCLGHPQQQGEYHHHVSPKCLYDQTDSTHHSPIIGYAFDGFPVYGAYAYTNVNGTGAIKRMKSSYVLSTATTRTNGPAVDATYPAGCYMEDYIYTAGAGDLDSRNGRFCVTPEYPQGIYAYFVTIDDALQPAYPYTLGTTYYGTVQSGNTGMTGGHNTPPGSDTTYTGTTGVSTIPTAIKYQLMNNPVKDYLFIYMDVENPNDVKGSLYDAQGKLLTTIDYMQPSIAYSMDFTKYANGTYYLHLETSKIKKVEKIIKIN
ncbi:MAG: YHYH protein [Bacteroidota bacterium]